MKTTKLPGLFVLLVVGGCEFGPFATQRPSYMIATIEAEAEDSEYRGSGIFQNGTAYFAPTVGISSEGTGASAQERISFRVFGDRKSEYEYRLLRLSVGTYELSDVMFADEPTNAAYSTYTVLGPDGDILEVYRSTGGTLVITRSDPKHLEGTFVFHGAEFGGLGEFIPEGRRITVSGSFAASFRGPADW
jgi:hypothetical protein